jgi:hypothetical protein
MDREEQEPEGQSPGGCGGKGTLGRERPGHGGFSGRGPTAGRQCPMDDGPGQRIPGAAGGCDGRSPAHARKGPGDGKFKNQRATESGDPDSRGRQASDRS